MYDDEETNTNKQLRFFKHKTSNEQLSILLVGDNLFGKLMQDSIDTLSKSTSTNVTISLAESVESIVNAVNSLHIDFIVFLMNTARRQSLEQVDRDICLLEPIYLCGRTLLVDACNHLPPGERGVSTDELFNLSQKYHLHILHGNIKVEQSCSNVARRILNIIPAVCGLNTGVPISLNFPIDHLPPY